MHKLELRIRELCIDLCACPKDEEAARIARELGLLIHQFMEGSRDRLAQPIIAAKQGVEENKKPHHIIWMIPRHTKRRA
jgi:hypothetical protein